MFVNYLTIAHGQHSLKTQVTMQSESRPRHATSDGKGRVVDCRPRNAGGLDRLDTIRTLGALRKDSVYDFHEDTI